MPEIIKSLLFLVATLWTIATPFLDIHSFATLFMNKNKTDGLGSGLPEA